MSKNNGLIIFILSILLGMTLAIGGKGNTNIILPGVFIIVCILSIVGLILSFVE